MKTVKRKIYLATESRARREIFKILGLRFKAMPAGIKEEENIDVDNLSYAGLVKINAMQKARGVAARIKSGVVIAADTITVKNNKIFGKPRNLKEARDMLKELSGGPQDIYTGVAVLDKDRKIELVDCEKTRVYMDKLTDKEIKNYLRQINPLNKAGSFDIQGKGALFIRRIEGCFYNVVGLPLRRVRLLLKRLDVKIFIFLLFFICPLFIFGCSTEYNIVTGEQEIYYYNTDKEVAMGQAISREVEKQYKLADDPLVQKRVRDIGKKIVAVCDRKEIDYIFKVLEDKEVNAFSLPGGFIYVNTGLIDKIANDSELACVLGHEVGHVVARHAIKKLQGMYGYSLLRLVIAYASGSGEVGATIDTAFMQLMLGYSREDELLADQLGTRYARLAGYDSSGMISFLKKLQETERRQPLRPKSYFKTHPYVPDRIRIVKQELGQTMSFEDYVNIEDQPHEESVR
ncbi:MAG: Maf and M48 domain-containing protein [Candidatus Omnitrophica bacterium]|nr:Maf and M48 domain-containing protein [Candidatus Omnitrophota bacterium]